SQTVCCRYMEARHPVHSRTKEVRHLCGHYVQSEMPHDELSREFAECRQLIALHCKSTNIGNETCITGTAVALPVHPLVVEELRSLRCERRREALLAHNDHGFSKCHPSQ